MTLGGMAGIPEKASRTVTPRAIFSPESGGRQNTSTVSVDIIMHGKTMLYLEGRNGEGLNILKVHTCFQRLHESCLAQGAGLTPLQSACNMQLMYYTVHRETHM